MRRHTHLLLVLLGVLSYMEPVGGYERNFEGETSASPIAAEASLANFHVPADVRIELVAAEPTVIDPIALRFDEQGRMWVVEMRDYPHGPREGEAPRSRISILEDRDGDGRFETSTIFADELLFATGVLPWHEGAFVTLAGRVAYLTDADRDGRADGDETWFTGFVEENPQLRACYPRLGLDHHIYVANGLRGGSIVSPRLAKSPEVSISGMDFRFDPRGDSFEGVSGMGQYGLTIDDFGRRFVCTNRNPLIHVVLESRYVRRNPYLALPGVTNDVAVADAASRVYPLTRAWTTSNLHAGTFTAASGVLMYRGDALPERYHGTAFTCESTGNLVHCERLESRGGTFASQPEQAGVEFLASTDEWFRPVYLEHGPDGALYVADMYRAVIEHPQWMPEELRTRRDLLDGNDRGRIYRVVAKDYVADAAPIDLTSMTSAQLVEQLDDRNAWRRETAARMLIERQDRSAIEVLDKLAQRGKTAEARSRALWLLAGLGGLDRDDAVDAMRDADPRVREQAVRLAEAWLADDVACRRSVIELANDVDARVRFQVALSLGDAMSDDVLPALATIALTDASDSWVRRAVATGLADRADRLLEQLFARLDRAAVNRMPGVCEMVAEFAELAGTAGDMQATCRTIAAAARRDGNDEIDVIEQVALCGLARGLRRRGETLSSVWDHARENDPAVMMNLERILGLSSKAARDRAVAAEIRATAIELQGYLPERESTELLLELAADETELHAQHIALAGLARRGERGIGMALLELLPRQTPAVRRVMLDVVLTQPEWTMTLLEAIHRGDISAQEIDPMRRQTLLQHSDQQVQSLAQDVFGTVSTAEREAVLREYRRTADLTGDPGRGRALFAKHCATCHRVADVGVDVGPDISDSRVKTELQLLTDILEPNRAIDANYISYTVVTVAGQIHVGLVAAETASSITLRQAENQTLTLLRSEIEQIHANGVSLMPEGLERSVTVEEMADLISFVKNWRYLDGAIPLEVGESKGVESNVIP